MTGREVLNPQGLAPLVPAYSVAIRSGDQIFVHTAAAAPSVLLDALVARAPELDSLVNDLDALVSRYRSRE